MLFFIIIAVSLRGIVISHTAMSHLKRYRGAKGTFYEGCNPHNRIENMFEYKIINANKHSDPGSEYQLNELGKEGWQLVAINTYNYPYPRYYFMRYLSTKTVLCKRQSTQKGKP